MKEIDKLEKYTGKPGTFSRNQVRNLRDFLRDPRLVAWIPLKVEQVWLDKETMLLVLKVSDIGGHIDVIDTFDVLFNDPKRSVNIRHELFVEMFQWMRNQGTDCFIFQCRFDVNRSMCTLTTEYAYDMHHRHWVNF